MLEKELIDKIDKYSEQIKREVISIRRELHKIPEIAFDLPKTHEYILNVLKKYSDVKIKTVGDKGIIALLEGKSKGKVVAYRADMDALPVLEKNNCDYKSQHKGQMHACGHDAHVAIALGIFKTLHSIKDRIKGTIKFIFQPAEEAAGGAENIIKAGALENPKIDYIFGSHVWPDIESGKIGIRSGGLMAGTDTFKIKITGKGGHAGIPHNAINPIVVASKIISEIEAIKSYFIDSGERTVVSICALNSGTTNNVIPNSAELLGTVRFFSIETQKIIIEKLNKIIKNISDIYGAKSVLEYKKICLPTINNKSIIKEIEKIMRNYGLEEKIYPAKASMGGEDFSFFLDKIPGAFIFLGIRNEEKNIVHELHHPNFKVDEEVFRPAISTFCKILLEFLNK